MSVCAILLVRLALRAALFNHSRWSLCGANRYGVSFADPYTPCFGFFPSVVSLRTVARPAPGLRTKFTFSGFKQTPECRLQLKISKTSGSFLHASEESRNFAGRRRYFRNITEPNKGYFRNCPAGQLLNIPIRPRVIPLDPRGRWLAIYRPRLCPGNLPRAARPLEPRQEVTFFLHHPLRGLDLSVLRPGNSLDPVSLKVER